MKLEQLRSSLSLPEREAASVDAILVSQADNRRYLSGFTGSAGLLLISQERAMIATDFRYYEQAEREAAEYELIRIKGKVSDQLPEMLTETSVQRLGFESQHLTVDQLNEWSALNKDIEWIPLKNTVEELRAVKQKREIQALRRSAALTDAAFAHLLEVIRPGMTESEAAWEIEAYMRTHGASKVAFDLIVAAGPNGALPHARPGSHAIQAGEPIVIDIGCVLDGYCSDMTRTFCLGQPSAKYMEVWGIVSQAQEAALNGIRAGTSGVEADALARDLIVETNYGDYFGHGLGHGVGLAVHEAPRASRLSEDILEAGMTLTIEPGIYLPGEFGVRIEDLVIIANEGVENLTTAPKQPVLG